MVFDLLQSESETPTQEEGRWAFNVLLTRLLALANLSSQVYTPH